MLTAMMSAYRLNKAEIAVCLHICLKWRLQAKVNLENAQDLENALHLGLWDKEWLLHPFLQESKAQVVS